MNAIDFTHRGLHVSGHRDALTVSAIGSNMVWFGRLNPAGDALVEHDDESGFDNPIIPPETSEKLAQLVVEHETSPRKRKLRPHPGGFPGWRR